MTTDTNTPERIDLPFDRKPVPAGWMMPGDIVLYQGFKAEVMTNEQICEGQWCDIVFRQNEQWFHMTVDTWGMPLGIILSTDIGKAM